MKRIKLKCLNDECDYQKTIVAFLTIPFDPALGATYEEIMATAPLLEKVRSAENVLDVSDEEHEIIVARLKNGRYKNISMDTYTMLKEITDA